MSSAMQQMMLLSAGRILGISPAVSGKSLWNLDTDGPLTLTASSYNIIPQSSFNATIKVVAAGGQGAGGGQNGVYLETAGAGAGSGGVQTVSNVAVVSGETLVATIGSCTASNNAGNYPAWGDGLNGNDGGDTHIDRGATQLANATGGKGGKGLQSSTGAGGLAGSPSGHAGTNAKTSEGYALNPTAYGTHSYLAFIGSNGGASPDGSTYGGGGKGGDSPTGSNPGGTNGVAGTSGYAVIA